MSMLKTGIKVHDDNCFAAELTRQNAVAAAIAAGGSTVQASVRAAEISFYRALISSAQSSGLPYGNFVFALQALGTGGS